jgi:hypothetical protein
LQSQVGAPLPVEGEGPTPQSLVSRASAPGATWDPPEDGWVPGGPAMRADGSFESQAAAPVPPRPAPAAAPAPRPVADFSRSDMQSPAEYAAGLGGETPSVRLADVGQLELAERARPVETNTAEAREDAVAAAPRRRRGLLVAVALAAVLGVGLVASGALHVGPAGVAGDAPLVQIDSEPSGADVYNDKEKIGVTPLKLPNTWPDRQPVMLRLARKGYADQELIFPGGQSQHLTLVLKKK